MLGCLCVIVGLRVLRLWVGWFKVLGTVLLWVFSVGCGCSFVGFCCMAVVVLGFVWVVRVGDLWVVGVVEW